MCRSLYCLENVFYSSWDNTLLLSFTSLHGVSFTSTGLSICKYCSIISFKNGLNNRQCCVLKYGLLFACWSKDGIKGKISDWRHIRFLWIGIFYTNSSLWLADLDNKLMILLFFIGWSASYNNLNGFSFWDGFNFGRHLKQNIERI